MPFDMRRLPTPLPLAFIPLFAVQCPPNRLFACPAPDVRCGHSMEAVENKKVGGGTKQEAYSLLSFDHKSIQLEELADDGLSLEACVALAGPLSHPSHFISSSCSSITKARVSLALDRL